jgi:hypothetical protein
MRTFSFFVRDLTVRPYDPCHDRVAHSPEEADMHGIMTFSSLTDALRAGFQIFDRTSDGYLVRTRTAAGWALAIVRVR